MELLLKDKAFKQENPQEGSFCFMKEKLCSEPYLVYPDQVKEFLLEARFSAHCLSAALTQKYDTNKRVVAYASRPLLVMNQTLPSNHLHHHHDDNASQGLFRVSINNLLFHQDSQFRTGVGIVWAGQSIDLLNHFQLCPKTTKYTEIAAVLIALQQVATLSLKQLVICSNSNYARHSFILHFPTGKANGMKTAWNKDVKHTELFLTCDEFVADKGKG